MVNSDKPTQNRTNNHIVTIYLGTDHRGRDLGQSLEAQIDQNTRYNFRWIMEAASGSQDDYVDVAAEVAKLVAADPYGRGILLCGSGVGVDIVANKVAGIRCALVYDVERAIQSREHEDINMIALPSDIVDQYTAWQIVAAFFKTPFSNAPRHKRRLKKLEYFEKFGHVPTLIPSILATNPEEFKQKATQIAEMDKNPFSWRHIDYMDGQFVDNTSVTPDQVGRSHQDEAHLMVEHPQQWIKQLVFMGVSRIIFHAESADDIGQTITLIRQCSPQVEIGLAINPATPVEKIESYLHRIDLVLVMTVEPGYGGQTFIDQFAKIAKLRALNAKMVIAVDGGITPPIAKQLLEVGANNLIIGSRLIAGKIADNYENFWIEIES